MTINTAIILTNIFAKEKTSAPILGTNYGDTLCGDCLRYANIGIEKVANFWLGYSHDKGLTRVDWELLKIVFEAARLVQENVSGIDFEPADN